tara:strand:+ start:57 stop:269 length:213 start_codon:yes stop_codon:yes gene_type:complete
MSYIDTQGISAPSNKPIDRTIKYPPLKVKKMKAFTDLERTELKEIIIEVLDEWSNKQYNESDEWLYRGTY